MYEHIPTIAWSPDGGTIAITNGNDINLLDTTTWKLVEKIPTHANVFGIAWSPDGGTIASSSENRINLWNVKTGKLSEKIPTYANVFGIAWSLDGKTIALVDGNRIKFWDIKTCKLRDTIITGGSTFGIAWSPDGGTIASSSENRINLWDAKTGKLHEKIMLDAPVYCVAFSPDGRSLAYGAKDTVHILNNKHEKATLEGHKDIILSISFSSNSKFISTKSIDNTVIIWNHDTLEMVNHIKEPFGPTYYLNTPHAFHPEAPILATLGINNSIHIWELDVDTLLGAPTTSSVQYTNAKVVLVGDSGVGKSGIGLVLSGEPFVATDSTHGRRVWKFDSKEVKLESSRKETRETILWDLAGQPGYRLIHQLHLNEVAAALVVFDARSETDPFAGVRYWDRALCQAQRIQGDSAPTMKKFLVAARIDRGGIGVSKSRIDSLVEDMGFDGYFETSARDGKNIAELADAIRKGLDWGSLPKVSSTKLFQCIKEFLIEEKETGRLLSTSKDLYSTFLKYGKYPSETDELFEPFETCIRLVESRGLIKKLSFGNLVLLQPELLDSYASALVNGAKEEPDGMGCIAEEDAKAGRFHLSEDERIKDKEIEKLLLIATIEDLLSHEIALRESADDGVHLVFPSQFTREWEDVPDPEGKAVVFRFEGPVLNIYSTLAVRLSHSGLFTKKDMWKNAVIYNAKVGGACGMYLREIGGGRGELTLFFDLVTSEETRFQFEEYVHTHLQRRALMETIHRQRIFACSNCHETITEKQAKRRRERGFDTINCPVCDTSISLLDREELLTSALISSTSEIDQSADIKRDLETATSIIQGKIETGDFDVFLCHNSVDKPKVKEIGEKLKEHGILPWLDEWDLRPGFPWQGELERQIEHIKSAAVFVGKDGLGPWQQKELDAFLREFVERECPVIPVLLSDAPKKPKLPIFLKGMTWTDFRENKPDPIENLIWGITGKRSIDPRLMKK